MSRIDILRKNYQRICALPWDQALAGPQRVWVAVYDKEDERKLRFRLPLFEEATHQTGHNWHHLDFTDAFAEWLCSPQNRDFAEGYFASPTRLGTSALRLFKAAVAEKLSHALQTVHPADLTVVAVSGLAALFGFLRISEILPNVQEHIRGRLLVFFPGVYEQDNYRLLDARDGWNYHAVPITASEGEARR